MIIQGSETTINIHTDKIEQSALSQLYKIANHPLFKDKQVHIMPDVHTGRDCVVGFTSTWDSFYAIPNIIGPDIGCNVCVTQVKDTNVDYNKLQKVINIVIPEKRKDFHKEAQEYMNGCLLTTYNELKVLCNRLKISFNDCINNLGTLGGGNHFISLEKGKTGLYLIIHSGSRNLGNLVYMYYNKLAVERCNYSDKTLRWLEGENATDYFFDLQICQSYALLNTQIMSDKICKSMKWKKLSMDVTPHNCCTGSYIRKGAIQRKDKMYIPMNMADGTLIVTTTTQDCNNSAPHGAGRAYSRSDAKSNLKMEDYKSKMKGIYTNCVNAASIGESPMAYKDTNEIIAVLENNNFEIVDRLKPLFNYRTCKKD